MRKLLSAILILVATTSVLLNAQSKPAAQKIDAEYTAKIK